MSLSGMALEAMNEHPEINMAKIKIEINRKYRLDDVAQAHKDLEARKIIGPAIIIP